MTNAERVAELARLRAFEEHRRAGNSGDAPRELVEKHASALAREIADAPAFESTERGVRQSTGMTPLNGELPSDKPVRTGGELRTFTDVTGREVRCFEKEHRFVDYVNNPHKLTRGDIANGIVSLVTGAPRYAAEARAMSEGVNTGGGVLVSEVVAATVLDLARAKSRLFELGATTIEMPSEALRIARIASDPEITVVGENAEIPMNDASFDAVQLFARKLGVIVPCSRELLEDASNAGEALLNAMANAMASTLDNLALNGGSGDGWLGLLNDPQIEETGSVGSPTWDDFIDAVGEVHDLNYEVNAILANPATWRTLAKLKEATTNAYLSPPPALDNIIKSDTTSCPAASALVGDFRQVVFGIRHGLILETSDTAGSAFQRHQTLLKAVLRGDSNILRPAFHRLTGIS